MLQQKNVTHVTHVAEKCDNMFKALLLKNKIFTFKFS